MKSAGAWFSRQIKATERSMLGIMVSIDGARGHLDKYRINSDIRDTSVLGDNAVFFVFFNSWPIIMCKAQNKSGRAYGKKEKTNAIAETEVSLISELIRYSNMESNVPDLEVEHDVVVEHRTPQGASVLVSVQDFQPRVSAVY
jgi:hypothetical protein